MFERYLKVAPVVNHSITYNYDISVYHRVHTIVKARHMQIMYKCQQPTIATSAINKYPNVWICALDLARLHVILHG